MPSGKIKIGHRDHIISPKFYKEFKEANPDVDISYKQFISIIRESNKEIARVVTTEQTGFKLPENLGYLTVTCYKSKNKSVDVFNSYKYNKKLYFLNLNTFGKRVAIRWFNNNNFAYYPKLYKFEGCRTFKRQVAKSTKEGFIYMNWSVKDFIKFDKISKLQNSKKKVKWES